MNVILLHTSAFDDNILETWFDYIKLNPDKRWNYYNLSKNPNITWDVVAAHPDKPWNYYALSNNPMTKHPFFKRQLCYVLK
jgi:hypothetical protein